jgi:hypothetical protein
MSGATTPPIRAVFFDLDDMVRLSNHERSQNARAVAERPGLR